MPVSAKLVISFKDSILEKDQGTSIAFELAN